MSRIKSLLKTYLRIEAEAFSNPIVDLLWIMAAGWAIFAPSKTPIKMLPMYAMCLFIFIVLPILKLWLRKVVEKSLHENR